MEYTIVPLAHVAVTGSDYNIYLSVCTTTRHMHVFKYNDTGCQYEIFDNALAANQFIEQPLPGTRSKNTR